MADTLTLFAERCKAKPRLWRRKLAFRARRFWRRLKPPRAPRVNRLICRACGWSNEFIAKLATPVTGDDIEGETALEYAWKKLEQIESDKEKMNAKDEALIRFAGTLAAAIFTAFKLAGLVLSFWFWLSLAALLVSMGLALHGRRTLIRQTAPPINQVLDGMRYQPERRWWTAAVLHSVVEAQLPHAQWQMRMNNWATNALIASLAFLFLAAATMRPSAEKAQESVVAAPAAEAGP